MRIEHVAALNELDLTERFDTIEGLCTVVYSHLAHHRSAAERLATLESRVKTLLGVVKQVRLCVSVSV